MMSYGKIYEFVFDSVSGAEIRIDILKAGYQGESTRRPIGAAPVLKRENRDHIFGTSLELFAECRVDGEYAQLYTSSAFEYKVELYKGNILLWNGFVSPELYSEPDIAPPYDVQIIATDTLGELKNDIFQAAGVKSVKNHLNTILGKSGIGMSYDIVSQLQYLDSSDIAHDDIFNVTVDLDHEAGNNCYDVLQNLLSTLHAGITQHNGRWLIFRETDFARNASENSVTAKDMTGEHRNLDIASFGSMDDCVWWPIGQLSTVIDPARKKVVLESENHYKGNVLNKDSWTASAMTTYDEVEGAYVLKNKNDYIAQKIDFGSTNIRYRLALRVKARNVGSGEEDQNLGVKVKIDGIGSGGRRDYWLVQAASSDRGIASYIWKTSEGQIDAELSIPTESDTAADAQDVDIILPLYNSGSRSFLGAYSVEVTVFNPAGTHSIYVYDVSMAKYEQFPGYQADVVIANGAREAGDDITIGFTPGETAPAAGDVFMTGIPMTSDGSIIQSWKVGEGDAADLLTTLAKDYAQEVALPKMRYTGTINVPVEAVAIPTLFQRDGAFYFPNTYSYDLLNDEMEVELTSISAAAVEVESVNITALSTESGTTATTAGGGSGIGSIPPDQEMSDTSTNAVQNKVIKAYVDKVDEKVIPIDEWYQNVGKYLHKDEKGIYTDENIRTSRQISAKGAGKEQSGEGGATTGEYKMYKHPQTEPSDEWRIEHGLGKFPNVKIVDSNKQLCMADVIYENDMVVIVKFNAPESGNAYLD